MLVAGLSIVFASTFMAAQGWLWSTGEPSASEYLEKRRLSNEELGKLGLRATLVVGTPLTIGGLIAPASTAFAWLVVVLTAMLGFWTCRRLVSRHPRLKLNREFWAAEAHIGSGDRQRPTVIMGVTIALVAATALIAIVELPSR